MPQTIFCYGGQQITIELCKLNEEEIMLHGSSWDGKAWKEEVTSFGFRVYLITEVANDLQGGFILRRASASVTA